MLFVRLARIAVTKRTAGAAKKARGSLGVVVQYSLLDLRDPIRGFPKTIPSGSLLGLFRKAFGWFSRPCGSVVISDRSAKIQVTHKPIILRRVPDSDVEAARIHPPSMGLNVPIRKCSLAKQETYMCAFAGSQPYPSECFELLQRTIVFRRWIADIDLRHLGAWKNARVTHIEFHD